MSKQKTVQLIVMMSMAYKKKLQRDLYDSHRSIIHTPIDCFWKKQNLDFIWCQAHNQKRKKKIKHHWFLPTIRGACVTVLIRDLKIIVKRQSLVLFFSSGFNFDIQLHRTIEL